MPATRFARWTALLLAILLTANIATTALGQLPAARLGSIYPAGGMAGGTLDVTIAGTDLDDANQLLFSHPGIAAKQKMAELGPFDKVPQPAANQFVVTVAGNVPPSVYEVRAVGKYGVSNPRAFVVGDIAETLEVEPNNELTTATEVTLPMVVNGQSNTAGDVDFYKFTAAAGQRLIITAYARRIDSPLDTVVTVSDAAGRQLGSSRDDHGLDSLVDIQIPAAGDYYLNVHDSAYQGSPEHVYRISAGVLPHIDFVFPPADLGAGNRPFTVYGRNLPGGQPAGLTIDGRPLEKLAVNIALPAAGAPNVIGSTRLDPAAAALDLAEYRIKGPQGLSNAVLVGVATAKPVTESPQNDSPTQAQVLTIPCEVMGQFFPQRDEDWYSFEARQGQAISVEVISQRMGAPCNPSLLVQRVVKAAEGDQPEQLQQLAFVFESDMQDGGSQFDIRHDDPQFLFTAPADGTYRVMVRDGLGGVLADPRRTYRLVVSSGQPDFRLAAVAEDAYSSVLLRKGGQVGIRVVAFRRDGFDGEIQVTATGLPAGVTGSDAVIGPSSNHAMLVLTAADGAAPATAAIQVVGKSKIGTADVTRIARVGASLAPTTARQDANQVVPAVDGRLTRELMVTVSAGETSPVSLQAGGGKVWEDSRGAQLKIPYTRGGPFKGAISIVPRGLPPNVNAPAVNLGANAAGGEVQVNLTANTPTGTYTFYLDAIAQQVDYNRNPEAAAAAAERKKEVDQIKLQADAEAKAATDAKAAADKLATDTTNAANTARAAKAVADKALADATTAEQQAAQQAAQAQAASAANPADANLKTVAANAKTAADDAAAKVKVAMANVVVADKALADAEVTAKTAADAKAVAEGKLAEKTQLAQLAAQLKTQTDQLATNLENAAKPQKRNVPLISTPITLKIAPAPITVTDIPAVTLKQGDKLEVAVNIGRLYNYTGPVNLQVVLPPGVGGLSIPNATVPANQAQAKLMVSTDANSTEGDHALRVVATLNLNGQNLQVEQPLRLIVQKGPTQQ